MTHVQNQDREELRRPRWRQRCPRRFAKTGRSHVTPRQSRGGRNALEARPDRAPIVPLDAPLAGAFRCGAHATECVSKIEIRPSTVNADHPPITCRLVPQRDVPIDPRRSTGRRGNLSVSPPMILSQKRTQPDQCCVPTTVVTTHQHEVSASVGESCRWKGGRGAQECMAAPFFRLTRAAVSRAPGLLISACLV